MDNRKKRLAPFVAAVAATGMVAAGCGSSSGGSGGGSSSGGSGGKTMTLTVLYRGESSSSVKLFQAIQQQLGQVGIKVKGLNSPTADFYTKYLQVPGQAKKGTWDLAIAGWGPDWFGTGAPSFFLPLFYGQKSFPPQGSNFGLYNNPKVNSAIDKAVTAASSSEANTAWGQADEQIMKDAAFFPLTDPKQPNYHSKNIHGAVAIPAIQNFDPTNLKKTGPQSNTLYMLGAGDVDYMDQNISYYSIGELAQRMWIRGLVAYPATPGKTTTVVPDVAKSMPKVSNGGKTYTFTLRNNVKWQDGTPVTAADFVRGVKRACNGVQPFGGLPDFNTLIQGYSQFCSSFEKAKSVPQIKKAINKPVSGLSAPNPTTLVFKLTHPASYFTEMLTMSAFNPANVKSLNYLPGSSAFAQHTIGNGPYMVKSYSPTKSIDFVKNPYWSQASDPVHKQNFDSIKVNETVSQDSAQQQLQTGSPTADMEFDDFPAASVVPGLVQKKDPNLALTPSSSSNPYILFNTVSPNNGGALKKVAVRQALSYALSREGMIKLMGGLEQNIPLTHVLPKEMEGSKNISMYSYNPDTAKKMLSKAGFSTNAQQ